MRFSKNLETTLGGQKERGQAPVPKYTFFTLKMFLRIREFAKKRKTEIIQVREGVS